MAHLSVNGVVEGDLDEAVLRRTGRHAGLDVRTVYGRQGKPQLKSSIGGYNSAAQRWPWIVLVDLDVDPCPASLRQEWLRDEAPFMCFRVAVHQIESWLLADASNLASFLGVRRGLLPGDPDSVSESKKLMVTLAGHSNKRRIREALVPSRGSKRQIGPLYNPLLTQFVREAWHPESAAERSESLNRALSSFDSLRRRWFASNKDA